MVEYLRLLSKIAVYLGNGSGQAQGCYGSLMGSQSYPIDPVDFDVVKTDLERIKQVSKSQTGPFFRQISSRMLIAFDHQRSNAAC